MYHFVATCPPEPLDLSEKVQIPGHIRQYLKAFQTDTLRFLHSHLANRDFCILNDESGLGKCVTTAVYLGAIAKSKNCLIVVQNDDELVTGWQFHFQVLTNLTVGVLGSNSSSFEPLPNIIIAKWATLRSTVEGSKYNFDYIIIDNRGQMMNNSFCMSMLLSNYERKINLLISSIDVTADLKLLHNSLRLGGHLEHRYEQFKSFEAKYKLPNSKEVLNKKVDLEEYFLKREMISDYCKDFRLRRYRHQFEDQLPLVDVERYKISLDLWHTISSSNSSQKSNDNANNLNANSETATEELFNQALALDREISGIMEARLSPGATYENNETSEDAITMSPLLIDSESCSSDEAEEVVDLADDEPKTNKQNQAEPDVYEFVDLSNEQSPEENFSPKRFETQYIHNKLNESHSTPRSHEKESNYQKTIQKIDNTNDLAVSQVNREKTKPEGFLDTLEKKTVEGDVEGNDDISKANTNVRTVDNKNSITNKRQTQTKSNTDGFSPNTNNVKLLRRRGLKHTEKNLKDTKNLKKSVNGEDTTPKEKCTGKRKLTNKDDNHTKERTVTAARTHTENSNAEKKKNVETRQKVNKVKKDISETSTRRLRHLRGDKKDISKDTPSVSPVRSRSVPSTTSTKIATKNVGVETKKSSNDSTICDTAKCKRKDRPKNKPRGEILNTPTVRNTRRMQRLTRSSDNSKSKYMTSPLYLDTRRKAKKRKGGQTDNCGREKQEDIDKSVDEENTRSNKKNKKTTLELEKGITENTQKPNETDLAILPCSDTTDDMQCGQKVIADTHSDNGFLRPPTPIRIVRNSEPKSFLPTPSSLTDSEVVFVPPPYAFNKNQQVVILSSSTDDGSVTSQQSAQSRRTRILKQKKSKRHTTDRERLVELSTTPTFGELLAKQRVHRKSPDIFSASTDLGITCTQQPAEDGNDAVETFQGFKIFGSEVKQMQQQNALNSTSKQNQSKQVMNRGRSCLNILEKMFDPHSSDVAGKTPRKQTKKQQPSTQSPDDKLVKRTTRGSQPVMPSLPNTNSAATQLQQLESRKDKSKLNPNKATANEIISGPMVDEEIFEITNNDAFGSMMRINSNGEISPVQTTSRNQQSTQHNKITNYLIGSTQLTPTEATLEERTPSKRTQNTQLSGTVARRSPKNRSTQSTKLTKWFQKNGATLNDTHSNAEQNELRVRKHTRSTIAKRLKRRCLELSFQN